MIKKLAILIILICATFQFSFAQDEVTIVSGPDFICDYSDVITYTYVVEYESGNLDGGYELEIVGFDGWIVSYVHESDDTDCQDPPELHRHDHFFTLGIPNNCSGKVTVIVAWNDSFSNWDAPLFRALLEVFPGPNVTVDWDLLHVEVNPNAPQCQCDANFKLLEDCDSDDCKFYFFNTSNAGIGSSIVSTIWKVKDLNGGVVKTYSSYNLAFNPPCNGPFQVCLEITNADGCVSEECMEFDVECTLCICVPGPDPCLGVIDDTKSLKNTNDDKDSLIENDGSDTRFANSSKSFVVYPNPSNDQFEILAEMPMSEDNNSIDIMDTSGKNVYHSKVSKGKIKHNIDLDLIPTGIYFLRITSNNKVLYQEKLVVSK